MTVENGLVDIIDRNARLPLYHQLYEIPHRKILQGSWKPGDRLPTETEMVEAYGVSRMTVRTVLDMLVRKR